MTPTLDGPPTGPIRTHPFRRAFVRGLGVMLPPLLTIVIFAWIGSTINVYVMQPVQGYSRVILARALTQSREFPDVTSNVDVVQYQDESYHRLPAMADGRPNRQWVPRAVYDVVMDPANQGGSLIPATPEAFYEQYVTLRYLRPQVVVPVFLCVFTLLMYLLGKFLAAGIGRFVWDSFEKLVWRLPLVRNVYSSVKQVTEFIFNEKPVQFSRVVAVEYPRRGIWSLGFVTSEGMLDIRAAAAEPVVSVLVPTSPMGLTGCTVTVRKSETIDMNITMDQAFEFIVSCGVVVPPQQLQRAKSIESTAERPSLADLPSTVPPLTISPEGSSAH